MAVADLCLKEIFWRIYECATWKSMIIYNGLSSIEGPCLPENDSEPFPSGRMCQVGYQ
jgi:hypothetical protein